jgi:hypothetical protein
VADRPKPASRLLVTSIIIAGTFIYLVTRHIDMNWTGEHLGSGWGTQLSITPAVIEVEGVWWRPPWKVIVPPFGERSDQWSIGNSLFGFLAGYRYLHLGGREVEIRQIVLTIPWWFIAAIVLARPLSRWLSRWISRRRKKIIDRQICTKCGYDLRASPDRCPECGQPKSALTERMV